MPVWVFLWHKFVSISFIYFIIYACLFICSIVLLFCSVVLFIYLSFIMYYLLSIIYYLLLITYHLLNCLFFIYYLLIFVLFRSWAGTSSSGQSSRSSTSRSTQTASSRWSQFLNPFLPDGKKYFFSKNTFFPDFLHLSMLFLIFSTPPRHKWVNPFLLRGSLWPPN